MNKPDKSSIFKASLLVALLGTAFGAQAAGLGKLSVYSAIGQPLNAEAALTASQDELNSLSAKLASHDAFRDAGIDFVPPLRGLRFNIAKSATGQPILRLTTDAPLNEPFLHFLVELNWTSGRMVREYTFLLDPPDMLQTAKPVSVVKPVAPALEAPAPQPVAKPLPVQAAPVKPAAKPAAASQAAAAPQAGQEIRVKAGDNLSKIARENKVESVSLDQMLVALFNSNRDVFDGNNMNRLRAGKILRLPDPAEAASVDPVEAHKLIVSQAADFSAYRRRLASAVGAAPATDLAPQQRVVGKIKPQVEETPPPGPVTKDKLEVSRTEATKAAKADGGKIALEEELIARDKALREAADRIAHLEKNLENLKQLVELKSEGGAKMQEKAQAAATPAPVVEKEPEPPPVKPAEVKPADAAPAVAAVTAAPAEPQVVPPKPAEAAPEAAKSPAPKPAVKKPLPPPPPPPEPSFVEDNPELVFGGGSLLALLLGYFGYTAWRKKKQAQAETEFVEPSSVQPSAEKTPEVSTAPSIVGQASDQADVSILGDFSEGGPLTAEGSVDPVAEADVLMAYGRDGQAEEILLEGLKTDPQHTAIHAKLLELYANRGDTGKFEATAKRLHDVNQGQGEAWEKAVALAAGLGVTGGVFAAAAASEMPAPSVMAESAPAVAEEAQAPAEEAAAAPPAQETVAPPVEEAASLDFDLDLGTTSTPAAAVEPPVAQPAAEEVMSLDFDFDLGTPEPAEAAAVVAEPTASEPAADSNAIDFSLDIGEPSVPAAAEAESAAPELAPSLGEGNVIDFDLDLGSIESVDESAGVAAEPSPALDLADISLDLEEPAPASAVGEEAPQAEAPISDFDLDIGLDLGEAEPAETAPAAVEEEALPSVELPLDVEPQAAPSEAEETVPEEEQEADDPEVATKLELAQAYEEMGDHEGARELLNEALNEGSAGQQALARARLDQLNAAS